MKQLFCTCKAAKKKEPFSTCKAAKMKQPFSTCKAAQMKQPFCIVTENSSQKKNANYISSAQDHFWIPQHPGCPQGLSSTEPSPQNVNNCAAFSSFCTHGVRVLTSVNIAAALGKSINCPAEIGRIFEAWQQLTKKRAKTMIPFSASSVGRNLKAKL